MTVAEILAKVVSHGYDQSIVDGKPWMLIYVSEIPDADPGDSSWDRYLEIQESLAAVGLMLVDAYLEHDCVSGEVQEVQPQSPMIPF